MNVQHVEAGMIYDRIIPFSENSLQFAREKMEPFGWAIVVVPPLQDHNKTDLWIVDTTSKDGETPGTFELERLYNYRRGRNPYTPVRMHMLNYGLSL